MDRSHEFGAMRQHSGTKAAAVRTLWDIDSPMAWLVADPNRGGHWAPYVEVEVEGWTDVVLIVDV